MVDDPGEDDTFTTHPLLASLKKSPFGRETKGASKRQAGTDTAP